MITDRPRRRVAELASGALARARSELALQTTGRAHRRGGFMLEGERYRYHAARYNSTWINERTVEIPIALRVLEAHSDARALELGNVLAHYGPADHVIVDKYERAPGVVNRDVLEFEDPDGFDAIVSISTLEHVGFEEEVTEPDKPARVMEHLAQLLRPGGRAVVTFPFAYNPGLDARVADRDPRLGDLVFLRRRTRDNRWEQVDLGGLAGVRYGAPYPGANGLVIATRHGPTS